MNGSVEQREIERQKQDGAGGYAAQAGVQTWEMVGARSSRSSGSLAKERMCAGRRAQEKDVVIRTHLVNSIDNLGSWGTGQHWH